jgi:DegV family protein with EDD domain
MAGVAVVTDSTASLAPDAADRAGLVVVALQVVLDGTSAPEGTDGVAAGKVAAALRSGRTVTTSRPSPESFSSGYREAAERGAESAVSVHLSGGISSTYEAAVLAARSAPIPVTVLDSRTLAMALGFAALAGADAAAAGGTVRDVVSVISRRAASSVAYFYVDSLEYLHRGGRIGAAQALLGSALAVKPLLTVKDGVIQPYERVRTTAKAVGRLEDLALTACATVSRPAELQLAVHHLDDPAGAHQLADRLQARLGEQRSDLPEPPEIVVSEMSAVLGVHVGPGTLGVIVSPG